MKLSTLRLPSTVYSGFDSLNNIESILKGNSVSRLAVFTDKGIRGAGLLNHAMKVIEKTGVTYSIFDNLPPEPSYIQAQELIDQCREYGADFIVAVGGGSVMDTAKLASLLIRGENTVKDLLDDPSLAHKNVKVLCIPTTAGTGAEATPNAIVAVPEKELKVGIVNHEMVSDYVILDPVMVKSIPRKIAAATGVDALAHAIECYTSNKANLFSDTFAMEALEMIFNNIEKACDDPDALEEKNKMQIASFYAGIAITSSGTTAVHALSYPLGGKYHIAHGVSNAILLAPVMKFNEDALYEKLAMVYDRCFRGDITSQEEKSHEVIKRLEEIVKHLDIPTSLTEFGVPKSDLEGLVESGLSVKRLLNNNIKVITADDARKIYSEVL